MGYQELFSNKIIKTLKENDLADKKLIVFFLLDLKPCSPCLNEITEYNNIINCDSIKKILIFFDDNDDKNEMVLRIAKFINLKIEITYGSQTDIKALTKQRVIEKCMIFYDIVKERFFFKKTLFSGEVTSYESKKKIIKAILTSS